jgi:hypothetical protein
MGMWQLKEGTYIKAATVGGLKIRNLARMF